MSSGNEPEDPGLLTDAVDILNRRLEVGDIVRLDLPDEVLRSMRWRVVGTRPILDPKAPPGMAVLIVQGQATINIKAGMPFNNVTFVMSREDAEERDRLLKQQEDPASALVRPN